MSTISSIKHYRDPTTGNGYHLFTDLILMDEDGDDPGPVFLELRGVDFKVQLNGDDGMALVEIPRPWAIALGLVPAE